MVKVFIGLFLVAACPLSGFAQNELTAPKIGPFNIKGNKLWQVGPNVTTFEVPTDPPFGRVQVLTGYTYQVERFVDGGWRQIVGGTVYGPRPHLRPGLILEPGTYRIAGDQFAWGYYAQVDSILYSGSDEYPPISKIWSVHNYGEMIKEFEIPANRVYVATFINGLIERFDGTRWETHVTGPREISLGLPGIRLGSGQYRLRVSATGDAAYCGGFITTEI